MGVICSVSEIVPCGNINKSHVLSVSERNILSNKIRKLDLPNLNVLCKIIFPGGMASGFLIYFNKSSENFFCLITCEHVITEDMIKQKNEITFLYDNERITKKIRLNPDERFIKNFRDIDLDAVVIEILPKDNIKKEFFLEQDINDFYDLNELVNKEIEIFQYARGNLSYSCGKISRIDNYEFTHLASTLEGSSGSPIFLKNQRKIIGIHKCCSTEEEENYGDFIKPIFDFFINFPEKITIIYNIDQNENKIKLFGNNFVENNKNKCCLSIDGVKVKLCQELTLNKDQQKKKMLEIKLIENELITNLSCLFYGCNSLYSLPDIYKLNTKNVTDMSHMFDGCISLKSLPDISIFDTKNVTDISYMFFNCKSLKTLPDILKWNTESITDMKFLFWNCKSLKFLPDISSWSTKNVNNMSYMFCSCTSLVSLPDISIWDTKNVSDMSFIFSDCISLANLPDISKWDTKNVTNMSWMFFNCNSLNSLPDISKWNTEKVLDISYMFSDCTSLRSLPDISKWNTNKVTDMSYIFWKVKNLGILSSIYTWKFSENYQRDKIPNIISKFD